MSLIHSLRGLRGQRAVCGFIDAPPEEWPEGHMWAESLADISVEIDDNEPCRECWNVKAFAAEMVRLGKCFAAMRDHRDAIRLLNTYRDTPSHMRGPEYDAARAKLESAYEQLRTIGCEP